MAAVSILIIEDEPAIADTLVYTLKTEGFRPVWRRTGGAGLDALSGGSFALVVLDVGLPDENGFEICKQIRARSAVPILFLTARNSEVDRIVGLEIGGDDYVTKPFSPREIGARVKAILRRTTGELSAPGNNSGLSSGLKIDEERCEASFAGRVLELTRYEFRLLGALAAKPGRVFSRDQLMEKAWEDPGSSTDRTVDAHIKSLRAKLRSVAPDVEFIKTHRGLGYSLNAT
jgi:two-component system catabolic regulation response regulator CreB